MLAHVSDGLHSRLIKSPTGKVSPTQNLQALECMARLFDLTGLPAELRVRISEP